MNTSRLRKYEALAYVILFFTPWVLVALTFFILYMSTGQIGR